MIEKVRDIANKTTMTEAEVAGTLLNQAINGLPLNLQFFAEGEPSGEPSEPSDEQKEETYTRSDVDREVSKAVEKAIQNQRAKWEEEKAKEIEQAKNEAEEYAKLTQKEKEEAELNKRLEQLEAREQELNRRELLTNIQNDLKENELPVELADTLITIEDNEKIKERITTIKEFIDKSVNEKVKEALRQDTPSESTGEISNDPFAAKLRKYQN